MGWALALVGMVAVATPGTSEAVTEAPLPMLLDAQGRIDAVDADGTNHRTLIADGHSADQTADGSRIVFVKTGQRRDAEGRLLTTTTLHVANADGSGQQPLGGRTVYGTNPRWSPDGRRVAYNPVPPDAIDSTSDPVVAVIDADGQHQTDIVVGANPDWSPDGARLVYEAGFRLWVVEARAGAPAVAITPAMATAGPPRLGPQWSPDGTLIGFGGDCVGVVHPDGSGLRCLTGSRPLNHRFGGWSPDSRQYAWSWSGFHQLGGTSWVDPATGESHFLSAVYGTAWATPSGPRPCGRGYWLLGRDGGVFTFGSAGFYGSTGGMVLNRPVIGIAPTVTNRGYWLVASDGGVFTFGDARFHGSTGGLALREPVVGMARTPSGNGYWLVARDGGVFTFGDARFHGSTGSVDLAAPVVGIAASPSGEGYLLAARDGGTFAFGDAEFPGSAADPGLPSPVTAAAPVGSGLLLVTATGEVAALDEARFCGSTRHVPLAAPIVAAAA